MGKLCILYFYSVKINIHHVTLIKRWGIQVSEWNPIKLCKSSQHVCGSWPSLPWPFTTVQWKPKVLMMQTLTSLVALYVVVMTICAIEKISTITTLVLSAYTFRGDSRFTPSQWETSLQSNAVSHWLGANLESSLKFVLSLVHIGCYCRSPKLIIMNYLKHPYPAIVFYRPDFFSCLRPSVCLAIMENVVS